MGIFDFLGGKSDSVKQKTVDPNAFQYGGRAGAAGEEADYYRSQAQGTDARGAPLADYGQANQARGMQGYAAGKMQEAMLGNAPSVAQVQQQQGTESAIANQLAAAASARGTGPAQAAAQRSAQQQGSAMAQGAVGQAAALRAQEIADARNAYAGLASGMRGQDLGAAQFQAGQELQSRGLNDQRALAEEQLRQGVMGAQMGAQGDYARLQAGEGRADAQAEQQNTAGVIGAVGSLFSDVRAKQDMSPIGGREAPPSGQQASGAQGVRNSIRAASDAATPEMRSNPVAGGGAGIAGGNAGLFGPGGLFGRKASDDSVPTTSMRGVGNAFTGFAQGARGFSSDQRGKMYSDERGKTASEGGRVSDSLLDTLKDSAATYSYRDPSNEPREAGPTGGKYLGVMAQDLERVPKIGRQLVSEGDNGMKSVEGGAALSAMMGGLGRITERLERLEQKGARRG